MSVTSPGELAPLLAALAEELHALTEPLSSGDNALPATLRLAVLTGETAHLVGHLLRNTVEGQREIARHLARPLRERFALPDSASSDEVLCAYYHRLFLGE